jgi:transposase InsO family protein
MAGPARHLNGGLPQKPSTICYSQVNKPVSRGLVEPGQYTSHDFRNLAKENGVVLSVSRKRECSDNAVAESFFASIKRELIDRRPWPTIAALHRAVFDWVEGWYNTRRLHSSLGYLSPAHYEALIHQNTSNHAA